MGIEGIFRTTAVCMLTRWMICPRGGWFAACGPAGGRHSGVPGTADACQVGWERAPGPALHVWPVGRLGWCWCLQYAVGASVCSHGLRLLSNRWAPMSVFDVLGVLGKPIAWAGCCHVAVLGATGVCWAPLEEVCTSMAGSERRQSIAG